MAELGVVVIGRNEGDRLHRCLLSLDPKSHPIVYVDSGSTDGSVELARSLGVEVVNLDLTIPFTAARARNAGFDQLLNIAPEIVYVQFVDGDCEVFPNWLETARKTLETHPQVAVACGRRRERHPEASVYNRLCDIEWNTPVGEARSCGGDALMRVCALEQVGGYDPAVIAAEDDEVCVRIRAAGWKISRIDADMTLHDAAMKRFGQWWKRALRCGYAYSQGAAMHGKPPERHFLRERRRLVLWGFLLPVLILGTTWPTTGWSLFGFLLYPIQMARIARGAKRKGIAAADAAAFGVSCVVSKLPEFLGFCKFYWTRWRRKPARIIEYK